MHHTTTATTTATTTPNLDTLDAIAVEYRSEPTGEIVATEAAVDALADTRRWVLLRAIILFVVGGIALLAGGGMGVAAVVDYGTNDFPFLVVVSTAGLLIGTITLIGAIHHIRFNSALGTACRLRRPEDLERALLLQFRLYRGTTLALILLIAIPVAIVAGLIIADGNWP